MYVYSILYVFVFFLSIALSLTCAHSNAEKDVARWLQTHGRLIVVGDIHKWPQSILAFKSTRTHMATYVAAVSQTALRKHAISCGATAGRCP